jgi:hypothetical protein
MKNFKAIHIYSILKDPLSSQCRYFGNLNASLFHNRYFSPQNFNFDKHTLDESIYTMPNL